MHLYALLSIFEVIFMEKREVTHNEDLTYIVEQLIDQEKCLCMIEQLSMYNSKPIVYQASLVSAQALLLLYNSNDKEVFAKRQLKIMMTTSILLWNIRLIMSSASVRQQRLSSSVAALVIVGNLDCCSLISRIFPKSLLKKAVENIQYIEWKPENWKDFFVLIQNNYNTATEQWCEESRMELTTKLKSAAIDYLAVKYSRRVDSKEEMARWNHEEFQVQYTCLEQKCKVGKYYLKDLLNTKEGLVPFLNEQVMQPVSFWNVNTYFYFGRN